MRWPLAAITAILLLAEPQCSPVPAGREPSTNAPVVGKRCSLKFVPSERPWLEDNVILGRAAVWCNPAPESHHLEVWIEWRSPDLQWLRSGEIVISDIIPGSLPTNYTAVTACVPGPHRVAAWVTGVAEGKSYELKDHSRRELQVAASDCR